MKYIIGSGINGVFGGINRYEVVEADSLELAAEQAFYNACEDYEMNVGSHGLRSVLDIMEEEGCSKEQAELLFMEEREEWIVYDAELYSDERAKELGEALYNF